MEFSLYLLLSTLYALSSTSYSLHSTLYALRCTLYDVRCTMYDVRCTLYDLRSKIYALRSTLYDIRSTIFALRYSLYDIRSSIYALGSTLYALRSTAVRSTEVLSRHLLQPLFTHPVALWSEHLDRSWRVVGSNPIWDSHFSEFVFLRAFAISKIPKLLVSPPLPTPSPPNIKGSINEEGCWRSNSEWVIVSWAGLVTRHRLGHTDKQWNHETWEQVHRPRSYLLQRWTE